MNTYVSKETRAQCRHIYIHIAKCATTTNPEEMRKWGSRVTVVVLFWDDVDGVKRRDIVYVQTSVTDEYVQM